MSPSHAGSPSRTQRRALLLGAATAQAVAIVVLAIALQRRGHGDEMPVRTAPAHAPASPAMEPESAPAAADIERRPTEAAAQPQQGPARDARPSACVLIGTVHGKGKREPRQTTISLHGDDASRPLVQTSLGRDSSEFALPGLEPRSYTLRVRAQGFRPYEATVEVPPATDRVRHDVLLAPSWELRVEIVDQDGTPLHERWNALAKDRAGLFQAAPVVVATFAPPPAVLPSTELREPDVGFGRWSSAGGIFGETVNLPKRFAGRLELPEDRPLFVSAVLRTAVLATEHVEPGQEEVKLTVPLERALATLVTLRAQVIDGDSKQPIAEARVGLSDSQSSGQGQPTDADGRVELAWQRPGLLNVDVFAKGKVTPPWNVDAAPGATIDLGPLPVATPVEVAATLDGVPSGAEVSVSLQSLDPPPHPALRPRHAHYGRTQGNAWKKTIAPGRYRLQASGPGCFGVAEFDTRSLAGKPVQVAMRGTAKLRITPPADRRLELAISDASGLPRFRRWLSWTTTFDLDLVPGDYTVVLTPLGGQPEPARPLHVDPGGTALDLR